jgi:hypothetical protein
MDRQFPLFRFWAPSDPVNVIWQSELYTKVHSDIRVVSTHYVGSKRTVLNWPFERFCRPPTSRRWWLWVSSQSVSTCVVSCEDHVATIAALSTDIAAVIRVACTRVVRKLSVHFEYLENRSRGLNVTLQPVRGDLTAHLLTVTLP